MRQMGYWFLGLIVMAFAFCTDENVDPDKWLNPDLATAYMEIDNAVLLPDDMPATTGGPGIMLIRENYTAVPTFGFDLQFVVDGDFAGAYLQVDGATGYYDIPLSSIEVLRRKDHRGLGLRTTLREDAFAIHIGFNEEPEEGWFCAKILPYDSDGNTVPEGISICAAVTKWGGAESLFEGTYKYKRIEEYEGGILSDVLDVEWGFDNPGYVFYNICGVETGIADVLSYAGFIQNSDIEFADLIAHWVQEAEPDCDQYIFHDFYRGNFAFNQEANEIVFVDFQYARETAFIGGEWDYYIEDFVGGNLFVFGTIEYASTDSLIIKETYNPIFNDYTIYYFGR